MPKDQNLKELRKICNKKNILLILDEVQCGIGRSGDFFAFESSKVKPDIVPIAKGIGGGFPIGAVLMNKKVSKAMVPGTHGSTFGGNPLAMSVGNEVMDIISNKKFLKNVQNLSKYFLKNLNITKDKYPNIIKQIRGKGLLIGIQLHKDQTLFIKKLLGFLTILINQELFFNLTKVWLSEADIQIQTFESEFMKFLLRWHQ